MHPRFEQRRHKNPIERHAAFSEQLGERVEALATVVGTGALSLAAEVGFMKHYVADRLGIAREPQASQPYLREARLEEERNHPLSQDFPLPPSGTVRVIGPRQQN